ncbi:hypothetical protein DD238_003654 [Peronospora effusa]|uniref:Uncharacterized protein n=1 Tax=Peronospora effusa TaxID=542832 RepID=A0A3M6VJ05_9STRA|nr:hypothetical protein DD238_003654 [Peronospora effusa]
MLVQVLVNTRNVLLTRAQSASISKVLIEFTKELTRPSFNDMCKWQYEVVVSDGVTNPCRRTTESGKFIIRSRFVRTVHVLLRPRISQTAKASIGKVLLPALMANAGVMGLSAIPLIDYNDSAGVYSGNSSQKQ